MEYAGFWKRLMAGIIDFLVIMPYTAIHIWGSSGSLAGMVFFEVLSCFMYPGYSIYFHGRYGQTFGKMAMGIRVISLDGSQLSWKRSFYRSSFEILFGVFQTIVNLYALMQISAIEYASLSWTDQGTRLQELTPLSTELMILANIWIWSEVVVMLTNKRRRSLHDFIAQSVVVKV